MSSITDFPFDLPTNDYNLDVNPFKLAGVGQSQRMRALVKISVGGVDVTDNLNPYLISVRVITAKDATYNCEIELDDRDAQLPIPPLGAPVVVELGWTTETMVVSFDGWTVDVEHAFQRNQGGRRMFIYASGTPLFTAVKAPIAMHLGDGAPPGQEEGTMLPLSQWLQKVWGVAGLPIQIHPQLGSIARDYWSINNESPLHHTQRLAKELGAVFNVVGSNANFSVPGEAPDGTANIINAVWGQNLISWRVRPWEARSTWMESAQEYFDHGAGVWNKLTQQLSAGSATFQAPQPAGSSTIAGQQNDGNQAASKYGNGGGRLCINGEPSAIAPFCYVSIQGARPGVDGTWLVVQAEHLYSREGYLTWLTVTPLFQPGTAPGSTATSAATGFLAGATFFGAPTTPGSTAPAGAPTTGSTGPTPGAPAATGGS
jgi:uncharacterized protein